MSKRDGEYSEKDSHKKSRSSHSSEVKHKISMDDYKAKNKEFCVWLRKKKDIYFDTLHTDEAKRYFAKFVQKWNDGELSDKYYSGEYADTTADSSSSRTGFKWGFARSLDREEKKKLESIREHINDGSVGSAATVASSAAATHASRPAPSAQSFSEGLLPYPGSSASSSARAPGVRQGPTMPDREDLDHAKKDWDKKERAAFYKRQKDDLEELVPKETGRDAKLDKRRAMRADRAARDVSPDLNERNIMGDNFDVRSAVVRQREAAEARTSSKRDAAREKLQEHEEREKAKMAELLQFARAARSESSLWKG